MKINLKLYLLLPFLATCHAIFGQALDGIEPANFKSPDAANVGLSGSYPVSYFTGVPNIGIPLYTISEKGVSIPIGIDYHASGVKVDMHPGWVGLNWNMEAGGVISRSVYGARPDDFNNSNLPKGDHAGYYFNHNLLNGSNWNDPANMTSIDQTTQKSNDGQISDTEPDEFNFEFGEYSGKFYLGDDGNWKVKCDQPLKVTFNNQFLPVPFTSVPNDFANGVNNGYSPTFSGFTITTEDGTQYVFGGNTDAIEYSLAFFHQQSDQWTANSWYLTSIINKNGKKVADFTYEPDDYICQITDHFVAGMLTSTMFLHDFGLATRGLASSVLIRPTYLRKIVTDNFNVVLSRSTSTELRYDDQVFWPFAYSCYNLNGFDYAAFPFLLLNKQASSWSEPFIDNLLASWWPLGYSGDKARQLLFEMSLDKLQWKQLDNIAIQDKNGTLIKGYNFTYSNDSYQRLTLLKLTEVNSDMSLKPPYNFSYVQPLTPDQSLPPYAVEISDHWGFFNGNYSNSNDLYYSQYSNLYDQTIIDNYHNAREPNPYYLQVGTLSRIDYPAGGATEFVYEPNDYSRQLLDVRSDGYQDINVDKLCGGLRIKRITSIGDGYNLTKEYFYVRNYNALYSPGIGYYRSSGVLDKKILYGYKDLPLTNLANQSQLALSVSNNSLFSAGFNTQGNSVGYSEVVEKLSDGSYTKFYFTNFDNGHLDEPVVSLQPTLTPYGPYTSNDEERGKLYKSEIYNSNNAIVKTVEYQYTTTNKNTDFVKALKGCGWSLDGDGADVNLGIAYKFYTNSCILSQAKETLFDITGANPLTTIKNFYYENPIHKQVTKTETIDSKGNIRTVINRYPSDMVNIGQNIPYQNMVNLNMQNSVIEQEEQLNGVKLRKKTIQFAIDNATNLIAPSFVQTQHNSDPPEIRLNYWNYDEDGNPLSFSQAGAPKVNYVWSYGGLSAVAKITNADYATIETTLGGSAAVSSFANTFPTEAQLNAFLAPLRTSPALSDAQITTYAYAIGNGMTSATDARGYTVHYEYDSWNRLVNIRNQSNNITKHIEYNIPVKLTEIYYNISKSGKFYASCGNSKSSLPVIYTVPAGIFSSAISQADADNQAQSMIDNNGQTYANAHHSCNVLYNSQ